jgi:putative tricarboxylic transport membrane protein
MAVGLFFFIGSLILGLGSLSEPGAGFFPFIMSGLLVFFSLVHFLSSLTLDRPEGDLQDKRFWPEKDGIRRIVLMNMSLFMFVVLVNPLGFIFTTFLFLFFLLRFIEPQKWSTVFIITIVSTGSSYLIFQLWLKADLPTGLLGF